MNMSAIMTVRGNWQVPYMDTSLQKKLTENAGVLQLYIRTM